jgi:hypothetical protein
MDGEHVWEYFDLERTFVREWIWEFGVWELGIEEWLLIPTKQGTIICRISSHIPRHSCHAVVSVIIS